MERVYTQKHELNEQIIELEKSCLAKLSKQDILPISAQKSIKRPNGSVNLSATQRNVNELTAEVVTTPDCPARHLLHEPCSPHN